MIKNNGNVIRSKAFTLVEMLIVIAIIAVLSSILMVAMGRARTSAHAVESMSNLRSITVAYLSYASDNGGRFPATGVFSEGSWGDFWPDLLIKGGHLEIPEEQTYLNNRALHSREGVLWCPSEGNHHGIADYGVNLNILPHSRDVLPAIRVLEPSTTVLLAESRRKINDEEFGGSWWLKAEEWIGGGGFSEGAPSPPRHGDYMHVSFCDGRLEKLTSSEIFERRASLFTGPYDRTNPLYNN